jgi:6-phosphofructokinase
MRTPLCSPGQAKTDLRRVAILFSGGPAPAANAVIASAAICFSKNGIEVLGIRNGYTQLMEYKPGKKLTEGEAYKRLEHRDLDGARTSAGIMIGTARANPGKKIKRIEDLKDPQATAPLKTVYDALRSLEVEALVSIGGDDTLTTAAKFRAWQDTLPPDQKRIRVVHLPKTIDNDYHGIDFTFGYFTAVEFLATQCRNLLSDARSTNAYYVAQVMGRQAGWLAYGAAIAGESSLVIGLEDIPDAWWTTEDTVNPATGQKVLDEQGKPIPRKVIKLEPVIDRIVDTIVARDKEGKSYGVIVMAEGIAEHLPLGEIRECLPEQEYKDLAADEFGHFPVSQLKYTGRICRLVNDAYEKRTKKKKKKMSALQFGYEVRCQIPTAFDVILGSQVGVGAYRALAEKGKDAVMVSVTGQLALTYEPFANLIDPKTLRAKARPINPEEDFHQLARYLEVKVSE